MESNDGNLVLLLYVVHPLIIAREILSNLFEFRFPEKNEHFSFQSFRKFCLIARDSKKD